MHAITETEAWAITRFIRAEIADLSLAPTREFSGETLRCLMLGLPVVGYEAGVPLSGMGVRLKNAVLTDGCLNLEHGTGRTDKAMPRLSLENCDVKDGINLKSARLGRLCLKDSRLSELLADHAHIYGLLDIRGIQGHPNGPLPGLRGQSRCRLALSGVHIEDGIEAGGARLVGPPQNPAYAKYSERAPYALELPEAQINGDLRFFPDFSALGGVNLNGATINGSLQAHGANLVAGQLYALDACGALIHGNLALDSRTVSAVEHERARALGRARKGTDRFICEGQLRLHNVVIDEDLRLYGARIHGDNGRIAAAHMTVRGDVNFCAFDDALGERHKNGDSKTDFIPHIFPFECEHRVDMRGARIGGDLNFKGAELGGKLDVSDSQIGGQLLCSPQVHCEKAPEHHRDKSLAARFCAHDDIKFDNTTIAGNARFDGAQLRKELRAYGMTVKGYANFSPFVPQNQTGVVWPFETHGIAILDSVTIGQKCDFSGAQLYNELKAPNLKIGGKLLMCAFTEGRDAKDFLWFQAKQRVNLSGAELHGDFDLRGSRLYLGMRFRGGSVRSALIIDIFDPPGAQPVSEQKRSIDLFNAHANILADEHYEGDFQLGYGKSYFLRLEGFSYSRFRHSVDDESLSADGIARTAELRRQLAYQEGKNLAPHLGNAPSSSANLDKWLPVRLEWLNKQYREGKPRARNYNPDPYNTLYRFYKRMGAQTLADKVLHRKLHTERVVGDPVQRIIYWPFEFFYGFGLRPIPASLFYFGFIILAMGTIWLADHQTGDYYGAVNLAKMQVAIQPSDFPGSQLHIGRLGRVPVENEDEPGRCDKDDALRTLDYAFETFIPTLDLGEKRRCDFAGNAGNMALDVEDHWKGRAKPDSSAVIMQALKLIMTLLGWTATSLTVLTWTGLFRRNVEP